MIEQFGLRHYASFSDALTMRWRNKKNGETNFSTFTAGSKFSSITRVIGMDRTVWFAALCIVFRCAYDEMEE